MTCPHCTALLARPFAPKPSLVLKAGQPKPGPNLSDYAVCCLCARIMIFGANHTLRTLDAQEIAALPADVQAVLSFRVSLIERSKRMGL